MDGWIKIIFYCCWCFVLNRNGYLFALRTFDSRSQPDDVPFDRGQKVWKNVTFSSKKLANLDIRDGTTSFFYCCWRFALSQNGHHQRATFSFENCNSGFISGSEPDDVSYDSSQNVAKIKKYAIPSGKKLIILISEMETRYFLVSNVSSAVETDTIISALLISSRTFNSRNEPDDVPDNSGQNVGKKSKRSDSIRRSCWSCFLGWNHVIFYCFRRFALDRNGYHQGTTVRFETFQLSIWTWWCSLRLWSKRRKKQKWNDFIKKKDCFS